VRKNLTIFVLTAVTVASLTLAVAQNPAAPPAQGKGRGGGRGAKKGPAGLLPRLSDGKPDLTGVWNGFGGSGNDAPSTHALSVLRDDIIPATVGRVDGASVNVSGDAASSEDFASQLKSRLPLIFVFVFGLAFLLMLVTFRSIVIPIKAILLNLLSIGAAYGVLVLVFQQGHGESLLGFTSIGGVTNWLPLFLFVVLFGLSMDYHVFILSRVRELYDRGMSTDEAIKQGISTTAGTVTSAAAVMIGVFAVFVTLTFLDFKEMGFGLAVAVLIDATIIRGVLLPASMKLLGDWNWYLPRWLEWLPRVGAERDATPPSGFPAPDEPETADGPGHAPAPA